MDRRRRARPMQLAARVEPLARALVAALPGRRPPPAAARELRRRSRASRRSGVAERNRALVPAARPVLDRLSRAIADTRYFAILTDADGIVVDVGALPGGSDPAARHARDIARIGVDLSERAVGTTAIGAALAEHAAGVAASRRTFLRRHQHLQLRRRAAVRPARRMHRHARPDRRAGGRAAGAARIWRRCRHAASRTRWCRATPASCCCSIDWPGCVAGADTEGLLCIDADGNVTRRQCRGAPHAAPAAGRGDRRCIATTSSRCRRRCCSMPRGAATPCSKCRCGRACGCRPGRGWRGRPRPGAARRRRCAAAARRRDRPDPQGRRRRPRQCGARPRAHSASAARRSTASWAGASERSPTGCGPHRPSDNSLQIVAIVSVC